MNITDMLNKIHLGDCLEFMRKMPDKCVDLVLTDPPYGTTACAWDIIVPFEELWIELKRVTSDNATFCFTSSQPFTTIMISSNIEMYKYNWVWDKSKAGNIFLAKYQPMKIHEDVVIFSKDKPIFNPQKTKRRELKISKNYGTGKTMGGNNEKENTIYEYDDKFPESIISFSNANQSDKIHPTQKPIQLMKYLAETYSNKGFKILDPFSGSGTTALACHDLNLDFICIEKDPDYHAASVKRLEEHQKQGKLF